MNRKELLSLLKKNGDRQEDLAAAIGLSRTRFNSKINERGGATFTQPEILAIKKRYSLDSNQVNTIFFSTNVS